ncbi:DUF6482 family protein [Colwellia sp. C1TZA3]|uniref:DUF6482 family protein n=1 Tax=Colwellia sp. C1TZA3 TaxID=2508879 RepID=UPI0011B97827|nr:DUF6482 family protein [Colwellia sp. C1TZA3]TWX69968.1 hypothetical protein ESZ39_11195 [Colwellia sp. C1TZA3]
MQLSSTPSSQPMIIAVAGSNHYLVGVIDSSDNFVGLRQSSAAVVNSIVEAKAYLRGNNIFSALLEMDSAFDEMCGQSKSSRYRQRILC